MFPCKLTSPEGPGSRLGTTGPGVAGKNSLGEGPALGPMSAPVVNGKLLLGGEQSIV